MQLDESTLKKVATLARIKIAPADIKEYTQALSNILTWIQQLEAVDTTAIGLSAIHQIQQAPLRDDVVCHDNQRDQILANSPDKGSDIFFSVPKVIE